MPAVTNISTYLFAPLTGLKELRAELQDSCKAWALKGTILLSPEGINLFVAGAAGSIEALLDRLRSIAGLEGLTPKVSLSDDQPFNRMLVRIKKEIIAFGVDTVRPADHTSPKIAPRELKRWLDEGRPLTLLDTRNDYEVRLGTFKGAIDPRIRTFREFPKAVDALPETLKDQPVVMFCTGGIRCEKAGPYMEQVGFKNVLQLDGGILKYFEECGGAHYDGDCFVFDQRVGLDPALRESGHAVCFACLAPLDEDDQADPRYIEGRSCPHCHKSEPEQMAARIAALEETLQRVAHPLPGSLPRENHRPVHIPASLDRHPLLDALCALFPHIPRDEWNQRCADGRFTNYAGDRRGADHVVRAGERILQCFPPEAEPPVSADIRVLHVDEALIAVAKPAPLPMHPSGRFHRNTLQHLMSLACAPQAPRPVHRLDADTTGLVVFARTRHFCRVLQRQFIDGRVTKTYLVRIHGHPPDDDFTCTAAILDEPGPAGTREITGDPAGKPCETRFRVRKRHTDGTALLEAEPITGRTHQIRLHLSHLGFPVVGDRCYGESADPDTTGPAAPTSPPAAPPLMLHAWKLALRHPLTHQDLELVAPPPAWAD